MKVDDKLPPSNREAEQSVLGACLIDNDAIPRVASVLKTQDFHYQELREIWAAMLALHERNEPVDVLTIPAEMHQDYVPILAELINEVPTSIHAEHYAKMVARLATRRRLLAASGKIAEAAFDDNQTPGDVSALALRLILEADSTNGDGGMQSLSRLMRDYYDRIEALARSGGTLGLPTGFRDLDKIIGGLQRTDLILLAARPRIGKTSMALCIARNVAKAGKRVVFFSLEMSRDQVTRRLTALEGEIGISSLKTGKLAEFEWPVFMKTTDSLDRLPLWIDDRPGITPAHLRAEAMKVEATAGPLDLIIVDYLQLMRTGHKSQGRYEDVTEIGQALKALAKDLNVPVLALSQLNRNCESRADKHPQLHDLRESGDLEQTANVVLFIYRDEVYDPNTAAVNLADVDVAKNRDGGEGRAQLYFQKHLARFLDADITREVL